MRVLHLSTFDEVGGAARSAMRLHCGLQSAGVDSAMLVRTKTSQRQDVNTCRGSEQLGSGFWRRVQSRYVDAHRTSISNSLFTAGYPAREIVDDPMVASADVIHAHWIWNFLSPVSLSRVFGLGKPVVWTFHDQRALSGGCHFSAGCTGFLDGCENCPQLTRDPVHLPARNLKDQRDLWAVRDITVVAPSRWMAEQARRSALFSGSRVEVIPYGLETELFYPRAKEEARTELGIPNDAFCLLFGAESGTEVRKGARVLIEALKRVFAALTEADQLQFVSFGAPNPEFESLGERFRSLGVLKGHEALRTAYSAADVFVLPSLEDTLPNTMLEALACGTPVLSFDGAGGVRETLIETGAGWAAETGDPGSMAARILECFRNRRACEDAGRAGRRRILTEHTLAMQAERHAALYASLTPPRGRSQRRASGRVGPHLRAAIPQLMLDLLSR